MDYRRTALYLFLAGILFLLWTAWQKDYPPMPVSNTVQATPIVETNQSGVPPQSAITEQGASKTTVISQNKKESKKIEIKTDVLDVLIDTQGGDFIRASLPGYPASLNNKNEPVVLFSDSPTDTYVAESGLLGEQGPDTPKGQAIYSAEKDHYVLAPDQQTLQVQLQWRNEQGLIVTKIFTFTRGKYDVNVGYQIDNKAKAPWIGYVYAQLKRHKPQISTSIFDLHTFDGAAISSSETPYEKISYDQLAKTNVDRNIKGGWLAFQQRYFLSAWIPNQDTINHYYSQVDSSQTQMYTIGYVGPKLSVPPGSVLSTSTTLYAGPEIAENLKSLAPHLDLTIDYGWLWIISVAIFWVMKQIHNFVGNWGVSIILVTLLIKLIFYKLSETSYRSMAKMRKLAPKLEAIKQRYGDDRQKMSQETMGLYRKEKVNPLGGCLPMIVQIPFFFALYYVLIESVQLRHAPFIFWIHDLSSKDPFYILPILMGISMFLQQKLNPPPPDPMQAKMFMLMPIIFTVFFLAFPAGLVLYWLTNNVISILQQWYIMRKYDENVIKKKLIKSKT